MSGFNHIDPNNIDLNNLPRELEIMVAVMLTVQHCGNRPADLGDLMNGLYGRVSDHTEESQMDCTNEFARILARLFTLGWITRPMNGTIILTDIGDEKATVLRKYYQATGQIDFSTLPTNP